MSYLPPFLPTDRVCHQQGLSLWVPFQNSATALTNLYKGIRTALLSFHFCIVFPKTDLGGSWIGCFGVNVSASVCFYMMK